MNVPSEDESATELEQLLHRRNDPAAAPPPAALSDVWAIVERLEAAAPPAPSAEFVARLGALLAATPQLTPPPSRLPRFRAWLFGGLVGAAAAMALLWFFIRPAPPRAAPVLASKTSAPTASIAAPERANALIGRISAAPLLPEERQQLLAEYARTVDEAARSLSPEAGAIFIAEQRTQIEALRGTLDDSTIASLLAALPVVDAITPLVSPITISPTATRIIPAASASPSPSPTPTPAAPTPLPIQPAPATTIPQPIPSASMPSAVVPSVPAIPSATNVPIAPTVALPTLIAPTLELPTIAPPTLIAPTLELPTIALPTLIVPTLELPTIALPTLPAVPTVVLPLPTVVLPTQPLPTSIIPLP